MRRFCVLTTIVLLSDLAGCGGGDGLKQVPIQGKLTIRGQPLDNTTIRFLPTGPTKSEGGSGRSDDGGNFTVMVSRAGDKNTAAGQYKVCVSRRITRDGKPLPAGAKPADYPGARESIPKPYSSVDETPLTVTVPEEGGEIAIDIPAQILGRK